MYCAVYCKPEERDAEKRLVVVRPFVAKPTIAWAVLHAALREERTGGIVAGPQDNLEACIDALEQQDQNWPNDPDRMIAALTVLAESFGCNVIFKQNLAPDSRTGMISKLLDMGNYTSHVSVDGDDIVLVATGEEIAAHANFMMSGVEFTAITPNRVQYRLKIEADVSNAMGDSLDVRLRLDQLEHLFELAVGPTSRRYRYILVVKNWNNSVVFFGTKNAANIRQAIAQYVDHLQGLEPDPTEEPETVPEVEDSEVDVPPVGNCRFFRLRI